jgi:transposase-like protein
VLESSTDGDNERQATFAPENPGQGRPYEPASILLCVRWALRYHFSYRDLEEMMVAHGLDMEQATIFRSVQCSAAQLEKRGHA